MPAPTDPIGQRPVQVPEGPRPAGLPSLVWSSSPARGPQSALQGQGLAHAAWLCLPWTQAARQLACPPAEGGVWVLAPDHRLGPSPQALARALRQLPPSALTVVLTPAKGASAGAVWLDAGADRCMPAASQACELAAMLRALLRRRQGLAASVVAFGPLRFDHHTQTLFHGDQRIWLTCRETQVSALLFRSGQQRTRAAEVLQALGAGQARTTNQALVALYVHRVNRKIRPHGVQIDLERGCGYRLRLIPPAPLPGLAPPLRASSQGNALTQWLSQVRSPWPLEPPARP